MRIIVSILTLLCMIVLTGCTKDDNELLNSFKLTFDSQGGSSVESQTVLSGEMATKPKAPTKPSSIFEGWYREVSYIHVWNFEKNIVTKDVTIYAKWTDINRESLQALIDKASFIPSKKYTNASITKMGLALLKAKELLQSSVTTQNEIAEGYMNLYNAMHALVEWPNSSTIGIITSLSRYEEIVYIATEQMIDVKTYGVDKYGWESIDSRVKFHSQNIIPLVDVDKYGQRVLYFTDNLFSFKLHKSVPSGTVIELLIESAELPVFKLLKFKVVSQSELLAKYFSIIDNLPEPSKVTHDDKALISYAFFIHRQLSRDLHNDENLVESYHKLILCSTATFDLPVRYLYNFTDENSCTLTSTEISTLTSFVPNGAFPAGSYTSTWIRFSLKGMLAQQRFTFNADGRFSTSVRFSNDYNEANATHWEDVTNGTYTFTEDKKGRGAFYMTNNKSKQ